MNVAVILAGGSGSRVGGETPKQFLPLAGRRVIERTIDAFQQQEGIDEICVVCRAGSMDEMEQIIRDNSWNKVRKLLAGGKERYESSLVAIRAYHKGDNLLLHDAARPLVSRRILSDCLAALRVHEAIGVAVPATDTVVEVTSQKTMRCVLNRSVLRNMQTPQCFRQEVIARAYENALQDPSFQTTDDCGVVFRYAPQTPVFLVDGEPCNLKITYPEDLLLAEAYLKKEKA
jgi:2-C-methyl-D-erythritol 4-phosphate cytidylyltransferase